MARRPYRSIVSAEREFDFDTADRGGAFRSFAEKARLVMLIKQKKVRGFSDPSGIFHSHHGDGIGGDFPLND
ncbi:MAG: hypothetical protein FJY91_00475 [Candidatus Harrisonbacteria bacterium]|nr:hypothetical protein [Candidatus Harrisonbacteria bacterium]